MVLHLVQNTHLQLSSMIQPQLDNTMLTKQTSYNFASSGLDQRSTKRPCDGILLDERPARRLKAHGGVSIDLIDDMQAIPQVNAQLPERSKRSTKVTKRPKSCPPKKAGTKKASAKKGTRRSTRLIRTETADGEDENATQEEMATTSPTASVQAATASTGMRRSDHVVPSTRRQRVHISVRQPIRYHCCGAEQALQPVKAPTQRLPYVGFRTEQT
jgi:hypothetical protein